CEYWYKEPMKRRLVLLPDGSVDDLTGKSPEDVAEIERMVVEAQAQGAPVRIEERDSHRVMRCVMTCNEVLEEPKEWPGRYIPIIPVVGEEIRIGRKVVRRGVVRLAKDPQRMVNYYVSAETEMVALQPKAPFVGTEKNFENYQDVWETANTENHPYLPYTPDPLNGGARPDRSQPPLSSQGLTNGILRNVDAMKAVIGIYDASLGARSNETSGVAIEARDQQGDTGSFVYVANFSEAINHSAIVIMDLIPHVYDTARTIRIVGEDGITVEPQQINQPQGVAEDGIAQIMNDVTTGAYDVVVKMGPAYDSLRSEAREGMTAMIQAGGPELFAITGDMIAKMQDWPNADELAERLEAIAPPAIKALIAQKRGEPPQPPQPSPQEQEAQAKFALQQQEAEQAAALKRQQAELDAELERQKAEQQMALAERRMLFEMTLERQKFEHERALAEDRAALDAQLKAFSARSAAESRAASQNGTGIA
ncbi:MAG: portal protein, partial [Pararhizobium sp.]